MIRQAHDTCAIESAAMSSSSTSGIEVAADLKSAYEQARRNGQTAFIKVQIVGDKLNGVHTERKSGLGWARDFDTVQRHLDDTVPCFVIFFRGSQELMLLQYTPDNASPKDKMSYSASKAALNTLVNARQFAASGASSGSSKQVEQFFGTSKADFTHKAYTAHKGQQGPMSEVEEALAELPKTIDKKEFGKSMGYSLLATVSGKPLPPQLQNYASGNAAAVSSSLYRGSSQNFYSKPSEARKANPGAAFSANRPPAGQPTLPGWGASSPKSGGSASPPASSPSSASYPSPSQAAAAYKAACAAASPKSGSDSGLTVATGKCLVGTCDNRRVKNGYCQPCLTASAERREKVFAGTDS